MKKDNGICGVGVAYNAKVGGIRINLDSSSDVIESSALGYRNDYINIYSNSWGPSDSGYHVDGPGELLTATLENGVKTVTYNNYILFSYQLL
jgi:furin